MTNPSSNSIALFSANSSIQTRLLAQFISENLAMQCLVIKSLSKLPKTTTLILFDCGDPDMDLLNKCMGTLSASAREVGAALINVNYESAHEQLLDWPCVNGLFHIDTDEEQFLRGLQRILEGDYWVPRRLLHDFFDKNRKGGKTKTQTAIQLTKREKEILKMLKHGASNLDISSNLGVSEHTVKSHLYNIYRKIGARNRREASSWVKEQEDIDAL
ncbi:CsgBAC operon transcriptional regulatory protein [Thalassocella blandensis]|nr:CsgBAC operon transcriptional regulatory protein [Thalassocella blandensis]